MIQDRPYRGEADYQRVRHLLVESYRISGTMHNWSLDCWDWFRYNTKVFEEIADAPSWEEDVRLWETEEGRLVGAVLLDGPELTLQVHPLCRQIEEEMLDWAEQHHQAGRPGGAGSWPLSTWVFDYDRERQALLEGRGYSNLGHDGTMRRRSAEIPFPEHGLPQGYALRALADGDREDLAKRAAIANNAFGITKHTAETIQTLQKAPTYRPDLDLVVVGPDGNFAAYCVVWWDEANRIGIFGPVGTHPAHGRQGLGKAMMREGLALLDGLKAKMAYVHCDLDEAPNRLYESVGFRECGRLYHWQHAGSDLGTIGQGEKSAGGDGHDGECH